MVGGPTPESTESKIARGVRQDRINGDSPVSPKGIPDMPDVVADDPVAAGQWDRITGEMHAMGIITLADYAVLMLYCCAYSDWISAQKELASEKRSVEGYRGPKVANPLVKVIRDARTEMARYLEQLGMTPSSRSRLSIGGGSEKKKSSFVGGKPAPPVLKLPGA